MSTPEITPESLSQGGAFMRALGMRFDQIGADGVLGHVLLGVDHHTPWGVVHGGVYAALAESAASIGASLAVQDRGQFAVGVHNATDFLRSTREDRLEVEATPLQQGRVQQLWLVTMRRDDGKDVARSQVRLQNIPLPKGERD
jgi:1,4-dihydroxy-2-naphthoyl-CoA hydrolase